MKTLVVMLLMSISFETLAARNPYCDDFVRIKNLRARLDKNQVDRILPYADWMDEQYRRKDQKQAASIAAKTAFLLLIKRLTPFAYMFEPTRLGDGTITGMYAANPQN